MGKNEGFKVEITSDYDEFWRYNVMVTCGCFDDKEQRVGYASVDDTIAPIGSNLEKCPTDYPATRVASFETVPCDHLQMYIYLMPHTLPVDSFIDDYDPFELSVRISRGGKVVSKERLSVNMWSSATKELRVDGRGVKVIKDC